MDMITNEKQLKGILITCTGAAMWGLNAVAGKYVMGTKGVDPVWMVTLRLILAGLIFLGIAVVKSKGQGAFDIWKDKKSVFRLLVVAIFAFAICQTSYFAAIDLSNAGISTAIQQTSPVFVLLWVMLLEKRAPKKVEILVLVMVIFGAFLYGVTLIGPLIRSILGLIEPVVAAFASVLLLRQVFTVADIVGIVAILEGVTILSAYKGKE